MPDIATALMDSVNVIEPPTYYETNNAGWYIFTEFADPPLQSAPVPCALAQMVWEYLNDVN